MVCILNIHKMGYGWLSVVLFLLYIPIAYMYAKYNENENKGTQHIYTFTYIGIYHNLKDL